ncbi:hypothetical protein GCM10022381_10470 [Leifsonia kafniensis]|uniref:Sporulation protein n=1 Tax=Leifsonia kafniensis TaxID=475957 RepID=A0ABP7KA58_9MICO
MTNLIVKLAENIGTIGVKAAYGEPVTVDGVTILPVAFVQFGFGAGTDGGTEDNGDDADSEERGASSSGGGGGGLSIPVGAYVTENGRARFEPNLISLLAVGIPFVWVSGHALARVIRALKR